VPQVFIARQPIFDDRLDVAGYELLFRGQNQDAAVISDDDAATSTVVLNAFTEIGLETVVGDRRAWINVSRDFLLSGMALALPPGRVVLELLEDQAVDQELLDAIDRHRDAGHTIALDDFVWSEDRVPLITRASIVKLDVFARTPAEIEAEVERLYPYAATLLAEKVETRADYERCVELGFELFQGYFFCKPEIMDARRVAPNRLSVLQLVAALQDPSTEISQLESLISRDVALSYRLLRYINSAYFGLRREVDSISRGLMLLGLDNIKRWAVLTVFAGVDEKPRELVETALVRARFCELAGEGNRDELFTLGLFSVVDALLDVSMEDVVASMPFTEEMRTALVEHSGPKGALLSAALSFERGDFEPPLDSFGQAWIDALSWATATATELFGATREPAQPGPPAAVAH
jgi:EAL and modified HD-GYP domain-containing signal transduction protein